MTMPGFTAEASCYHTRNHYAMTSANAQGADGRTVIPQLIKCKSCICNSPFDCPCDDCTLIPELPPQFPTGPLTRKRR